MLIENNAKINVKASICRPLLSSALNEIRNLIHPMSTQTPPLEKPGAIVMKHLFSITDTIDIFDGEFYRQNLLAMYKLAMCNA
jgi:hypothetical protein